jgi:hypothetical protein
MDNIIQPSSSFDFSELKLSLPVTTQSYYFSKITFQNEPFYIKCPKCFTKQGIIKTNKRIHTDLMFENIETELMNFIESLEEKCVELIYKQSSTWFEDPIEKVDIDNAFIPTLKLYKSGKFFLIHVFIKPTIRFFNEEQMTIPLEEIKDESMLTIIEIKGIKFNNKSFQIEIELKQSMIIKADPFSEKCFFQKPNYSESLEQKSLKIEINNTIEEPKIEEIKEIKEEGMMEINIEDLLNSDGEENMRITIGEDDEDLDVEEEI